MVPRHSTTAAHCFLRLKYHHWDFNLSHCLPLQSNVRMSRQGPRHLRRVLLLRLLLEHVLQWLQVRPQQNATEVQVARGAARRGSVDHMTFRFTVP